MGIRAMQNGAHNVGDFQIEVIAADASISSGINKFLDGIDSRAGNLFNLKIMVRLSLSNDIDETRQKFFSSPECSYNGTDMPKGWELRNYGEGHIFYAPRRSAFIDLKNGDTELQVGVHAPSFDLNVVRLASIDLLQLATTHLLVHSVALEKDGRGILLLGESRSGKTTLLAQLINSGYKCNLVSEGYSLIADGTIVQVKTAGLLRSGALHYLNIDAPQEVDVEFGNYIGTVSSVGRVDYVISPSFNLDGEYATRPVSLSVKPVYRDWALQALDCAARETLLRKKAEHVVNLPKEGTLLRYSTDSRKTAVLFNDVLGV
jgi:tRNA A37 threonylcarbamoyladenosine biosynthesis protein TsaE